MRPPSYFKSGDIKIAVAGKQVFINIVCRPKNYHKNFF